MPVCPPVRPTVCLYLFLSFGLTDLPVCLFVFQPVCTVWKKVRMKWNWVRMFGRAEKTCDAWPQHLGLDEELSVGLFIVWLLCMTSALIHSKEVRYQIDDRFSCRCDCYHTGVSVVRGIWKYSYPSRLWLSFSLVRTFLAINSIIQMLSTSFCVVIFLQSPPCWEKKTSLILFKTKLTIRKLTGYTSFCLSVAATSGQLQ